MAGQGGVASIGDDVYNIYSPHTASAKPNFVIIALDSITGYV